MANLKFSGFTENAAIDQNPTTGSYIVGYEGNANTNNRWTFTQVAAGLAAVTATPYSIYAGDGTITTGRKALLAGTLQFRNSGDSSDVFKLNTDGTFALGLGAAAAGGYTAVAMGNAAAAANSYSISIGSSSDTSATYAIAIGGGATGAQATGQDSIAIGGNAATAAGAFSTAIGYSAITAGDHSINIGRKSRGSANNAITLNASTDAVAPSTHQAFNVYMSSNSTPDLTIDAASGSTVNSNLKITGQGYSEQHGTPLAGATIDWNNGNIQYIQLASGANTLSLSNPKSGATYILQVKQPSSGAAGTITYPTSVKYPGGSKPTLTTDNDAIDIITLIYNGTTTHYYANATLDLK